MSDHPWGEVRTDRQQRHARWKEENLRILRESGLPFTERPEACLFRSATGPRADFYPSTGRWRVPGGKRTFRGGARAFLAWCGRGGTTP